MRNGLDHTPATSPSPSTVTLGLWQIKRSQSAIFFNVSSRFGSGWSEPLRCRRGCIQKVDYRGDGKLEVMIGKEQALLLGKHEHSITSTTLSRDTRQSCHLSIYLLNKWTAAAPKDGYNLSFRHDGISAKRVFPWADLERRPPTMFQFGSSSRILDPSCRMALRISSNLYYRIRIHWGAKNQREKGTTPKRWLVEQEEMDLLHHDGCGGAESLTLQKPMYQ